MDEHTGLTPGTRLHSAVDATEVMVLRAASPDVVLTCGGRPMTLSKVAPVPGEAGDGAGTQIGRRYSDEAAGIEVICTTPGGATLAVDGVPLAPREPKALPSSD